MKYIIMCGGKYDRWKTPRHLLKINNEPLVERTIRLLRENGIKDISISTDNPAFEYLNIPLLKHENSYNCEKGQIYGYWCDAFYPTDEPTCYIFGDVFFSPKAIKTIIKTQTDDIEFFASKKPFAHNYFKPYEEPFALKVVNTKHLKEAIQRTKKLADENKFQRKPIMWELWGIIKDAPLGTKIDDSIVEYVAINDYTCDIDGVADIVKLEYTLNKKERIGDTDMIKVEVVESFTLGRFNELENVVRKGTDVKGLLNVGDTFECKQDLADYLLGGNKLNKAFVKVIEVIPVETPTPNAVEVKIPKEVVKSLSEKVNKLKTTKKKSTK